MSLLSNGYFRIKEGLDKDNNYTYAMVDKKGNYVIRPDIYTALGLINEYGATLYIKRNPFEIGYIDTKGDTWKKRMIPTHPKR